MLEKLGVLIIADFLEPAECARVCEEMRGAPRTDALVSQRGRDDEVVDPRRRQSEWAQVSDATRTFMVERFLAIKPRIERFFGMPLADIVEAPKFLIYQEGDFFVPHRDVVGPHERVSSPIIQARRINLVVGLNGESAEPGSGGYVGAALTLYGLVDEPEWRQFGFAVPGVAGSLVAFRSDVLHEVAPIVSGERYNIVSRMLDPGYQAQPITPSVANGPDEIEPA